MKFNNLDTFKNWIEEEYSAWEHCCIHLNFKLGMEILYDYHNHIKEIERIDDIVNILGTYICSINATARDIGIIVANKDPIHFEYFLENIIDDEHYIGNDILNNKTFEQNVYKEFAKAMLSYDWIIEGKKYFFLDPYFWNKRRVKQGAFQ